MKADELRKELAETIEHYVGSQAYAGLPDWKKIMSKIDQYASQRCKEQRENGERLWNVDEIISVLDGHEDAGEHARWFDEHGR